MTSDPPDFFATADAVPPITTPPSLEASLLAGRIMRGEVTATTATELIAALLLETVEQADAVVVALTLVPPCPINGWSRLGERAWVREWAKPGTAYAAGPRLSEAQGALSMPWLSQLARRNGYTVVDEEHPFPESATTDRREAAAYGLGSSITCTLLGDETMMGSLALNSRSTTPWPPGAVSDIVLLKSALTGLLATERARSALAESVARGDRALESQQHFFTAIEHDLRPPLVDLQARPGLEEAVRTAAAETLSVVDDVLLIRNELARPNQTWIALTEAVGDAMHWTRAAAGLRGVAVTVEIDEPLEVRTTGVALRHILVNLLDNAISRTAEGGTVRLSASLVGTELAQPRVRLSVHDGGPALPLEQQDQLFRPTRSLQSHVPGLGLSLSRTFAERDGGTMGASSTAEAGAFLWADLPGRFASPR